VRVSYSRGASGKTGNIRYSVSPYGNVRADIELSGGGVKERRAPIVQS